jgi:8-oxo-dGTP pyrophosphatase MutT (NUDIX family)
MVIEPLIEKKRYGSIYDYIIVYDFVPADVKLPEFEKDVWVSIQINKKLDLSKFRNLLVGYHTHRFYRDKDYYLFFNDSAKDRLPVYNPMLKLHQHINVMITVDGKRLKVKSRYGSSWRFVSGGVHSFEKPENAVRRELKEELGIQYDGKINFLSSKIIKMSIPVLSKPIKTQMYYYSIELDKLPKLIIDKEELSQVKLGDMIIDD